MKSESEVAQSYPTLSDPMGCGLPGSWDFPGKSTGVGCHCLFDITDDTNRQEQYTIKGKLKVNAFRSEILFTR